MLQTNSVDVSQDEQTSVPVRKHLAQQIKNGGFNVPERSLAQEVAGLLGGQVLLSYVECERVVKHVQRLVKEGKHDNPREKNALVAEIIALHFRTQLV